MSGYKLSGMSQEYYQAMLAFAAYTGLEPGSEDLEGEFEALPVPELEKWRMVAAAVRDDTRTEPRW